jgi:hypothetical protein
MSGKFDSERDEAVWSITLDGGCETTGDSVEWSLWAAKVDVDEEFIDGETGARVEAGFYLVLENSVGGVTVYRFDDAASRDTEYDDVDRAYSEWAGTDDEE